MRLVTGFSVVSVGSMMVAVGLEIAILHDAFDWVSIRFKFEINLIFLLIQKEKNKYLNLQEFLSLRTRFDW